MKALRFLHPFALALLPVASLASHNILEMNVGDSIRSFGVALIVGAVSLGVGRLVAGDWKRGSLLASIAVLGLSSYGHTYAFLKQMKIAGEVVGRHRYLLPVYLTLAATGAWRVVRSDGPRDQVLAVLSGSLVAALIVPLANVARVEAVNALSGPSVRDRSIAAEAPRDQGDQLDVYYIILDGYGRHDYLEEWFDFENQDFLKGLEDRGFFVAEESTANYVGTGLSITSSLNMDYLTNLDLDLGRVGYPRDLIRAARHSAVRAQFETMGYSVVSFPSQYPPTEMEDAEYYFTPEVSPLARMRIVGRVNKFESLLLETTIARAFLDLQFLRTTLVGVFFDQRIDEFRADRRELLLSNFEHLKSIPAVPEPTFTFVHLVTPHRPYIFNRDGSIVSAEALETRSGNLRSDHNDFYLNQLIYVNSLVLDTIDSILARSERPPIIILQSDHGPEIAFDWAEPSPKALRTRIAILNAYLVPPRCAGDLYPSITPVNSFRVVFRCVYGKQLTLRPDRAYFSDIHNQSEVYDFIPVEDLLDE